MPNASRVFDYLLLFQDYRPRGHNELGCYWKLSLDKKKDCKNLFYFQVSWHGKQISNVSLFRYVSAVDWLVDFNGMSTHVGVFHAERLGNCIHSMSIFIFFVQLFLKRFWYTAIWYQVFLSNTNNLHTIIWFQVFSSNTDNLYSVLWFYVIDKNSPW